MLSSSIVSMLVFATWQTVLMVLVSSILGIGCGLLVGIVLFQWRHRELIYRPQYYRILAFVVNVVRSVPFIILLIGIIPFTRWVVGSSIGTAAAIVPLVVAAIPFYARIAESAFEEVPTGLIETAHAMGATHRQFILRFLLPEALPALIKGATLTVIGLIGYSAMAGAVGGGGLGELAINYGYQRFNVLVMLETVVILVIIVQLIQWWGDRCARTRRVLSTAIASFLVLFVGMLVSVSGSHSREATLRVGVISGPMQEVMAVAKKVAQRDYHLRIKVIAFDDYILPNTALADGEIDANIFQHIPYLNTQIQARNYSLTPLAKLFIYPMGYFSVKITQLDQLKTGSKIAIPNDPSNQGRALLLLQSSGLISLRPGVGLLATPRDIIRNPKQLHFVEMPAAQCPRALPDVAMAALTNDFVVPAGFTLHQALLHEQSDAPYANVIVVQSDRQDEVVLQTLTKVMHSQAVIDKTMQLFPDGAAIVAW